MRELRVGIIGIGNMGSNHLKGFINGEIKNARITALCDIDEEKLYSFKDKLSEDVKYFKNSEDLINSGLVDGVIIATPHYDHPIISISAFNAGLHVFCEKPAGVFAKNVRDMNEAAQKSGKVFAINFLLRTNPAFIKIKEIIDSGELGAIKRIVWIITDWYRTQAYYNSGGWRATWRGEGGGTLLNQNPHQLDLFQWFCGMPKRVRASCYFGKNRDIEVEDEATAYFEYENGAVGLYMTSVSEFPGTNRLEIAGDMGKLVYENNKIILTKNTISAEEFNRTTTQATADIPFWESEMTFKGGMTTHKGLYKMINNWVDSVLTGEKLIAPGEEGIKSLTLSNAIYMSAWNDGWIELPIDDDAFYDKLKEKIDTSKYVKEVVKQSVDVNDTFHK